MNTTSVADHSRHMVRRLQNRDPYITILVLGTIRSPIAAERRQQWYLRAIIFKCHQQSQIKEDTIEPSCLSEKLTSKHVEWGCLGIRAIKFVCSYHLHSAVSVDCCVVYCMCSVFETSMPRELPIVHEITTVLHEWHHLWKELYLVRCKAVWYLLHRPGSRHCHLVIVYCTLYVN